MLPRAIAVKGAYGTQNFGDDMLMIAACEIVKRAFGEKPDLMICSGSSYVGKLVSGATIISPTDSLRSVDVLIYGGGTQFYAFPLTAFRKNIGSLFSRFLFHAKRPVAFGKRLLQIIVSRLRPPKDKLRVAAIGVGLGPFVENSTALDRTKKIFRNLCYAAVRDIDSYDLGNKWGCENLRLRADLCYLPSLWRPYTSETRRSTIQSPVQRICVIPRDWPHTYEGNAYVTPLLDVVEDLRSHGKKVDFVSFSERGDKSWADRLEAESEPLFVWNPEHDNIEGFLERLSTYDLIITARYHGAVFASILGKPVVCIEIEQKLALIANTLGNGAALWRYPFNPSDCLMHVSEIDDDYQHKVEMIAEIVEAQSALAAKIVPELRNAIVGI